MLAPGGVPERRRDEDQGAWVAQDQGWQVGSDRWETTRADDEEAGARAGRGRAPSEAGAVARFMLASLAAVVLLAAVGLVVQRRLATDDAVREAEAMGELSGRGIVAPVLTDAALAGDPEALAALDAVVREHVLSGNVVRVKIWAGDGTVLYSDERRLIGSRYVLGEDDAAALRSGATEAEVSDLSAPENAYERRYGKLLEVYLPITTTSGRRVLYESYEPFEGVALDGRRVWLAFMPVLVGAVLLLWLTQAPLAWSMARRLKASKSERERLLTGTIEVAERERRRIAGDLHDGVVQDLAGAAMSLSAARSAVRTAPAERTEAVLDEGVSAIRNAMRELRYLIVDISPPGLADGGLRVALNDLIGPLADRGVRARIEVDDALVLDVETERLIYRVAQEGVRNAMRHAQATEIAVTVTGGGGVARLAVEDDGRGFSETDRTRARGEGHVGLDLLSSLVADARGSLAVQPRPGGGTSLQLEVPAP